MEMVPYVESLSITDATSGVGSAVRKKMHHHNVFQGATKRTTRHLAALDFLLNIPMERENLIRDKGRKKEEIIEVQLNDYNDLFNNAPDDYYGPTAGTASGQDYVGRKLPGALAPSGRVPIDFRYHLTRISEQSVVVRRWEEQILARDTASMAAVSGGGIVSVRVTPASSQSPPSRGVLASRVFFSRARGYPVATCSFIKYDAGAEAQKLNKQRADARKGQEAFALPLRDWRGFSYKPLFMPLAEERADANDYFFERGFMYDPNILDDPSMLHGSHRYVLERSAQTGPIVSSVILYVNEKELKQSLNDRFREMHPQLPPSLTLSKIRNIKKSALLGALTLDLEVSTVAYAVIYFERLCLQGTITKFNRHLGLSTCLVLAYKFNENISALYHSRLEKLFAFFDREWEVSRKEVIGAEFGSYVKLGFSLHIPHQHVSLVYLRLLKLVHKTSRAYLGDEMDNCYTQSAILLMQG